MSHQHMPKNDEVFGQSIPEFCFKYFNSTSAKLMLSNINKNIIQAKQEIGFQLYDGVSYQQLRKSIQELARIRYSKHLCDPREFSPTVLSVRHEFSCDEICRFCVPGSIPICFMRNPLYSGLAQVCLCTYDLWEPVNRAAFSLRHEKRIFSRRI
ncbi:unnamed protein product [Caenorhabditis sp. 36 PRJEB53466]|nr:unnamed protein product [Caenorhabditis sp. 36 PRJEB53466]